MINSQEAKVVDQIVSVEHLIFILVEHVTHEALQILPNRRSGDVKTRQPSRLLLFADWQLLEIIPFLRKFSKEQHDDLVRYCIQLLY